MGGSVVVLGSANVDQVLQVEALPRPGETALAKAASQFVGGKGLNQATACARAGAATSFLGAVGMDGSGDTVMRWLESEEIDASLLRREHGATGAAYVMVDSAGENLIVVAPGVNETLSTLTVSEEERIRSASILVLQCEVPISILGAAAAIGRRVILNAAPVTRIPAHVLDNVDVLVVNEHEARALAGDDVPDLAHALAARVRDVVITLGPKGAVWAGESGLGDCPAPPMNVVDTTGAGDAFVGYLAASLTAGLSWPDTIARAVRAGSLAVTRRGAAHAVPVASEVEALPEP
jgi:ribokinase